MKWNSDCEPGQISSNKLLQKIKQLQSLHREKESLESLFVLQCSIQPKAKTTTRVHASESENIKTHTKSEELSSCSIRTKFSQLMNTYDEHFSNHVIPFIISSFSVLGLFSCLVSLGWLKLNFNLKNRPVSDEPFKLRDAQIYCTGFIY